MRVKEILSTHIPAATADTPIDRCIEWMNIHDTTALPVVDDQRYYGIVLQHTTQNIIDDDEPVTAAVGATKIPAVYPDAHLLEAVNIFAQYQTSIVAVTTPDNIYCGYITLSDLMQAVAILCNTSHPATVIEVELLPEDYSATELTRLVEDNHSKVIGLFAYPMADSGLLRVQLRINRQDASAVLQSLERYNYQVVATYTPEGKIDERIKQRLQELMYYLEM